MALTSDIQQQVFDLLSKSSNLSFVSADQESGESSGLTPGQRVTAEVLTILPNSRVQVQIGAERFNLNLPVAVRPGQNLELTFVTGEPRTTFAIARQGGESAPPISLSDASRLLGLLVSSEQIADSQARSSLQSIAGMLRSSPGESGVLANLMDEALTYSGVQGESAIAAEIQGGVGIQVRDGQGTALQGILTPEQARLAAFESNASQILQQIARNSRFNLIEAVNQPVVPLMLSPGQEVDAAVQGTLPGGRVFVTVAGTALELVLPRAVAEGEILRLTVVASQPKPVFALSRTVPETAQGDLSGAGRWLSILEHGEGGVSDQQRYVLDRLTTVLKSLPPDSPAFTAIQDEAITYQTIMDGGQQNAVRNAALGMSSAISQQSTLQQQGNGIVLSDDMTKLLQALIRGNRLALVEPLDQQAQPTAFAAGQQLKGEVLTALGGGRFLMQVADQVFEFNMPKGTRPGDRANLFFIVNDPKPTFLMTRFGLPGDSQVSETGRWLSRFLDAAAEKMPARETLGLLRALLGGPPSDAVQVSATLQRGLRESGLFYESHLARWFGGEYALEDLLKEPQGCLSSLRQPGVTPMAVGGQAEKPLFADMKNTSLEAMEAAFRKAGSVRGYEDVVDQRNVPAVREQLESLQSGQIVFRGELFPGQPMEWTVNEREARRNSSGGRERSWDTALRVDLPKLGGVTARLKLDGKRVAIDFHANDSTSVGVLESEREGLVEQLQAAGLEPGEIGISYDAS